MTIPSAEGFLQASSCLPGTATEEREVVDALTREAEKNVKHGDLRYLVSQRSVPSDFPVTFSRSKLPALFRAESALRFGRSSACRVYHADRSDLGFQLEGWNPRCTILSRTRVPG